MLVVLVGSLIMAATIQHPRTDAVQIGLWHLRRLGLFQALAGGGLLLFAVQLIGRSRGGLGTRILLPLAIGTLLLLIVVSVRVFVLGRGGP